MPNFLTGGLSKLKGSRQRAADAAKQPPEAPFKYEGRLTASDFALSEGSAFGLGAVQPQTLAFDPHTQLIALCSKEGHVHFWGADLELCLRNPLAPVRVEFLLFPRPGFVLALGLAAAPGSTTSTWVAQWWDVQAGAQRTLSQALSLRFGITCATVAEGSALVFLGTDVGDVRAFDAGVTPGMADYCVPWPRLLPSTDHSADARPCPVTALDVAPNGVAEILVGGAEGCIALWGLERHKNLRTFDAGGPVSSMTWHVGGTSFVVAVRSELLVFQKSGSAIVSKVPLPGGPAQSVTLLRWSSVEGHRRRPSFPPTAAEVPGMHGDLLLRRGGPNPAVVNVRGPNWSEVDAVLNDAEAIGGAIVCSSPSTEASGLGTSSCRKSLGCVVPPWAIAASGVDEELTEESQAHMQVMELFTSAPLVLAVVGDPCMRVVVATLPPAPRLVWPAAWGSMELAGMTVQSLPAHRRIISRQLDSSSIADGTPREAQGGGGPCIGGGEEDGEETEAAECAGAAETDEPPPIPSRKDSAMEQEVDDAQDKQRFAQLAEAMLARRFANFVSFLDGREASPHEAAFASAWNSMAGGWLGTVCTGHCDGTLRIWLRAHAELLLLHTVSVVPLAPLPWRPQLEVPKGGSLPPEARLLPAEALARHDGVDSCPAVPVFGAACDGDKAASITAVAFSPHEGVLAGATASGCVAIFQWRDSSSAMPLGEFARWKASVLNPVPGSDAANPQVSELDDAAATAAVTGEEDQKECQQEEVSASESAIQAEAAATVEAQEAEQQDEIESRPLEATEGKAAAEKEEAGDEEVRRAADAVEEGAEAAEAEKQVIEEGRSGSKVADPLADANASVQQVDEPSPPVLPGGFVCCLHVQEHASAVNRLQLVEVGSGVLHAVSSDTLGRLCVQEVATGSMLFSGFPGSDSSVGEAATGVAQAKKTPPQVSVESFVFSSQVLHLPAEALPGSTAEAKANKSSSSSAGKSKHDSQVAAAKAAAEMALQLMQDGGGATDGSSLPGPSGAYIIVMSTGELRQLSVPDMRLLDGRIQQLRLPSIPAGSVLLQHLTASYMVIAQANAVHILLRPAPKTLAAPRTSSFEGRAVSAHFLQVQGEDCLYVLMATLTVQIFALPSMQLLTSVQTGPAADPFLVQLPSQRQPSTTASGTSSSSPAASSAAFSPGERGGCIGQDGYVAFRSGGSVGSRIWLAACQAEAAALDSAAWMMPIARIKQAAAPIPVPAVSAEPAPAASSSAGLGGFFGSLLGGGNVGPRGIRASVRPSTALPPELDASRIDKARGLPPAWQEYGSSSAKAPQPPPPPRKENAKGDLRSQLFGGAAPRASAEPRAEGKNPSERTSALGGAQAAASEAHQKALERGDKMNQLAQKSEQLQKDSEDFLKMAKQLNSRNQNRWF